MNPTCMRVGYDRPVRQGAELQELGKRGRRWHVGEVIELRGGEFRARIDRTGAGLQELTWRGRHVVWPYTSAEGPVAFQGQVLAPWPNRVRDGVYEHNGAEHHLKVNDLATKSAIHGLVHDRRWSVATLSEEEAHLRLDLEATPGFPFSLELEIGYHLGPDGLTVTTTARNPGAVSAPFGLGFHPYLSLGEPLGELAERGQVVLSSPARSRQPVDERLLPAGAPVPVAGGEFDLRAPGRELGETVLDTAFTDLDRDSEGRAWVHLTGPEHRVSLWCDASFGWLQLFSSDTLSGSHHRAHLAVEPMTCPPNALNSGIDLLLLAPGESTEHVFGITAGSSS